MSSPYPDDLAERDYYDENLSRGKGDGDIYGYEGELNIRYIGTDKVIVERKTDSTHWSELPKPVNTWPPREFGDNDKSDPEQNWDKE